VHHGAGRNAQDYTSYMTNAALRAGLSLDEVIVVGPQVFFTGDDGLDESAHIWWDTSSDDGLEDDSGERDWHWGGNSTVELPASISTFSVLDEMFLTLGDKNLYPNSERAVLAGHSAGGQITQRYALFSTVDALPIRYFVANPSSVTWLDKRRPVQAATKECNFCVNTTILSQKWDFEVPEASSSDCTATYDMYGYGLEGGLPDYLRATTVPRALEAYPARDVVYLSGESDVCDSAFMGEEECLECTPFDGGLDTSCEAEAQGWCRMARLHAFYQFVRLFYSNGTVHELVSVPGVGHSGCGMFQSDAFASAALL